MAKKKTAKKKKIESKNIIDISLMLERAFFAGLYAQGRIKNVVFGRISVKSITKGPNAGLIKISMPNILIEMPEGDDCRWPRSPVPPKDGDAKSK